MTIKTSTIGKVKPTYKKSLRVKMVKLVIEEFLENHLFDEFTDEIINDLNFKLINKLKETFSFKCDLGKFEIINSGIFGNVGMEKENGELTMINFSLSKNI